MSGFTNEAETETSQHTSILSGSMIITAEDMEVYAAGGEKEESYSLPFTALLQTVGKEQCKKSYSQKVL